MKVFNVFILSIFLSFISPLNKEEFIKNQNFKNLEETEIFYKNNLLLNLYLYLQKK